MELVRAFEQRTDEDLCLAVKYDVLPGEFRTEIRTDKFEKFVKTSRFPYAPADETEAKRLQKRFLKIAIYDTLVFLTGVSLPYGCLTGIRPTKLYAEMGERAHDAFLHDFSVRPEKLALIERIVAEQKGLRNPSPESIADLFVFVPFCPTRCAYCSFVSMPIDRQRKLLRPYTDNLTQEILYLRETARKTAIPSVPCTSAAARPPRFRYLCSTTCSPLAAARERLSSRLRRADRTPLRKRFSTCLPHAA